MSYDRAHLLPRIEEGFLTGKTAFVVPISLSEAKAFLRITHTDDDSTIILMLHAACEQAEKATGRTIMGKKLTLRLDGFPGLRLPWWDGVREGIESMYPSRELVLPRGPISLVNSVYTYGYDNTQSLYASSNYTVDIGDRDQPGRIILNVGSVWPVDLRPFLSVEISYNAGYVSVSDVNTLPIGLKIVLFKVLAWMYNNRGDLIPDDASEKSGMMPSLQSYKIANL